MEIVVNFSLLFLSMYEIFISLRFDFLCIYHYILQDNFLKLDLIISIISES